MARQSRRDRTTTRRRTQPALPHHLYERRDAEDDAPTQHESEPDTSATEATTLTLEAVPPPPTAPVQRGGAPAPVVPAVRRGSSVRDRVATTTRLAVTDYGYVLPELKRIFAVAAVVVVLLIIIAIVHR